MLWITWGALAAPAKRPPAVVYQVGEAEERVISTLQKKHEAVTVLPAVHLVQFTGEPSGTWEALETRARQIEAIPAEALPDWAPVRDELDGLLRRHPIVTDAAEKHIRVRLELQLLRASTVAGQANREVVPILGVLAAADPEVLTWIKDPEVRAQVEKAAEEQIEARHFKVVLGDDEVRWEGHPLEHQGATDLPAGLWDLVGVHGDRPSWTARVQVGGPIELDRILARQVESELGELLLPKVCTPALSPLALGWLQVTSARNPGSELFVVAGKELWRVQADGLQGTAGRCR